jgi:glycosyltransferase involved in cell wall biosynthesis
MIGESTTVAVNLLWCVPGGVGGSEEYLVRQLVGLVDQPTPFAPTLYCLSSFVGAHPELGSRFPMVAAGINGTSRPRRIVAENTWLARRTRHADVVHHGGGTVPTIGRRTRTQAIVLTIHDVQYLSHPEYLTATKLRYLRAAIPHSIRRATIVTVPTQYVRTTVVDRFDIEPDRVVVVSHGIEPDLGATMRSAVELRSAYRLGSGPVIVLPAITHPHKGHRFLLEVMAEHWTDPDLRLVLLGGEGSAEADVRRAIDCLDLTHRVVRPGRVPAADRDGLIAMADALVFPSEYEGFGAPVVEAMALGTPVISSDQEALAEVVGNAGLVLPRSADAWAGALDDVAARRSELIAAGHRRAAMYTSLASGAALAGAYRSAIEHNR